jgi:hypothetical protein
LLADGWLADRCLRHIASAAPHLFSRILLLTLVTSAHCIVASRLLIAFFLYQNSCLFQAPLDARNALTLLNNSITMPSTTSTLSASLPSTNSEKPAASTLDLLARAVLHLQAGDEGKGRESLMTIPITSLHQLLVMVPTLMTQWPHRLSLIKILRSLAPWRYTSAYRHHLLL